MRRILGIDPGLNRTGYGIVEVDSGTLRCIDSGVIRVPPSDLPHRLQTILRELALVIDRGAPNEASVEKVFVNINPQSTLLLGQARGAAICAAVGAGLAVYEYSALQVKQNTVGYGRADKAQMQKMVQRLLGLQRLPPSDAADALACAICHAHASSRPRSVAAQFEAAARTATASSLRAHGVRSPSRSRSAWRAFAGGK
ncbi:MAG TPA: crossover junction endodeoxyribonuclease RuvC [Burkholderiaceae bacterium]|nr:crossover junction endodeoxyribonuclease RuvC [Burkholderiaceae bacterium]